MSTSPQLRGVALFVLLYGLLSAACQQPKRRVLPPPPGPRERPVSTNFKSLSLRLSTYEGARDLLVSGTAEGDLSFQRKGGSIRCSNGVSRGHFMVHPKLRALTLGERSYPGAVKVSLHPEGGLRAEAQLDLEDYVRGVVAGELPLLRAHPAELEAQAVAARSYAISRCHERMRSGHAPFVWDDTRDQVYLPPQLAQSPALLEAHARLDAAISATRGEVLVRLGQLFDSRFHAACGGETAPLSAIPGSASAMCTACSGEGSGELEWSFTATQSELSAVADALGIGDRLLTLKPARSLEGERWSSVHLRGTAGSRTVSVGRLRSLLGSERFASNLVIRTWPHPGSAIMSGLRIDGHGRGHGVGLCQEGAHELAKGGWSKTRILAHYYPGTKAQSWSRAERP